MTREDENTYRTPKWLPSSDVDLFPYCLTHELTQGIMPMTPCSWFGKLSSDPSGHMTACGSLLTGVDHLGGQCVLY